MNVRWLTEAIPYDGSQLRPHWILRRTGIVGDAAVGWRGPCRIADDEMADLEDLLAGATIAGDDMVHIVWEMFDSRDLTTATTRQRLLAAMAGEQLAAAGSTVAIRRSGDDLYAGAGKLSISVATKSGVSSLIHFAVNATPAGVPVRAASLQELDIEPDAFGESLLARLQDEVAGIARARCRVRFRGADDEG